VYVSEIGGKLWKFSFDIESRSVPVDQRGSGKSVSHVMEPWAAAVTLRHGAETELLGQLCEGVARHAVRDSGTALGEKKGHELTGRKRRGLSFQRIFLERLQLMYEPARVATFQTSSAV